jgi:hypothetical protein
MTSCEIILDTNIALHFPRFDQLDWPALSGHRECAVVITPILLRELEQKKIFGATPSIKERAGKTIDYLVARMGDDEPIEARPGVTLRFMESEPATDFEANHLVRQVNDDHYIAAALERQAQTGVATMIASNDGGMALKLRSRPVSVLRLPDELRLPLEQDPRDKELRDTKAKLVQLQTQRPKLTVTFAGGDRKRVVKNGRSLPTNVEGLEEIKARHAPQPLPTPDPNAAPFSGDLAELSGLRAVFGPGSPAAIDRYNAALPQFYAEYGDYVSRLEAWLERLRLSTTVVVELHNDGAATATDVDVTLRFPEGIVLCRGRDFPEEPKAPRPPRKPGESSLGDRFARDLTIRPPFDLNVHDGAVHISERRRTVSFSAKSLKQKCLLAADEFILTRPPEMAGRGIEVLADITLHEGEPVHEKLAVTFVETDAAASDD